MKIDEDFDKIISVMKDKFNWRGVVGETITIYTNDLIKSTKFALGFNPINSNPVEAAKKTLKDAGYFIGNLRKVENVQPRLEYLRGELRAECISTDELIELQSLAEHIEEGDVELLEAAGVPEGTQK